MKNSAVGTICAAVLLVSMLVPIKAVGGGKDDLVAGMEQYAGIRFTERLSGDYRNGDALNAVVTDVEKFRKLGISAPTVKLGDPVTVKLLDKDSSSVAIFDSSRRTGKNFTVGDYGILTPAPGPAPTLQARSVARPPIDKANAVVIPRENCGTFWTGWGDDPSADMNPCPANCERGERLAVKQHKSGDKVQYQANYRCFLPELVVSQPPGTPRKPGATQPTNCGTFWTGRQSEPSADANPCPANCERGELLGVRRGSSDGKSHYEMWYRCYMAQ